MINTSFFSRSTVLLVTLFTTLQATAQLPQRPSGKPGKIELPTPNIQPLKPADLLVTGITFVSIIHNTATKTYVVKVIVTIRNDGQLRSAKTQLQGNYKTPTGGGSWRVMGEAGNIPSIDPGKHYSAVYSFKESALEVGGVHFDFRIKADSGNFVTESDETNNFSEIIIIDPKSH